MVVQRVGAAAVVHHPRPPRAGNLSRRDRGDEALPRRSGLFRTDGRVLPQEPLPGLARAEERCRSSSRPVPMEGRDTMTSSAVMKKTTLERSWNNGSSGRMLLGIIAFFVHRFMAKWGV
ncbi:hypothetical protein ASF23_14400 [Curtobacterium sp. Leaf261]|nr:hypothetical protein ASF23_14400 [Curtobacterium sp. Leaf261]